MCRFRLHDACKNCSIVQSSPVVFELHELHGGASLCLMYVRTYACKRGSNRFSYTPAVCTQAVIANARNPITVCKGYPIMVLERGRCTMYGHGTNLWWSADKKITFGAFDKPGEALCTW